MILVDDRQGSKHLAGPLRDMGIDVSLERLEYGDVAFMGYGAGGAVRRIGIEIKTIGEMVSDLASPRFSGYQMPGLLATYDMAYLLIEGAARPNRHNGKLEIPAGQHWAQAKLGGKALPYAVLWKHLLSIASGGVTLLRAYSRGETAFQVATAYWWWDKGIEAHTSHQRVYVPPAGVVETGAKASLRRLWAHNLPGIGWGRSAIVEKAFPSAYAMAVADETAWREIDGIGPKTAESVVRVIREEGL